MRRGGDERAASARVLDDGDGQRRALGRVCARAELVKEQQRALVARLQHTHGVGHVRRERGQRLLDALLVADVGHDLVEHGHGAAVGTRDVQAALRHCREQADGLERDGLAAGIRAGDDERVKFAAERHVDRHGGVLRQERMARAVQRELLIRERGRDCIELVGKLCLGKDEVEAHEHVKVARNVLAVRRALGRELGKDALDLGLFARVQLPQLVVRLHGGHRLDEQRRAGGRHIVHEPGHGALVLGLDRHDVALGARGDDRFLQRLGIARRGDDLLQRIVHARARRTDQAADGRKLARRAVGDLVLTGDGGEDLLLQIAVCLQRAEEVVDARLVLPVARAVAAHGARRLQHAGDVQQLARVERTAHVRALQCRAHILHAGKRRAALDDHHAGGGARLAEACLHHGAVAARPQGHGVGARRLTHGLRRQQRQHGRQLQRLQGFFVGIHRVSPLQGEKFRFRCAPRRSRARPAPPPRPQPDRRAGQMPWG